MDKLLLTTYINKATGDQITAADWNGVFEALQNKINELIDACGDEPTPETKESELYVNGVLHKENQVILDPAATYTLSGILYGELIINAESTTAPTGNTTLIFDDVTIKSDTNCAVLYKTPEKNKGYKDLIIQLKKDSKNVVVATQTEDRTDDQPGAIYSMNNMVVEGKGYLAVANNGGHGIRATELKVAGPHIYTNVNHDAVHAGKLLEIDDCTIHAEKCNDVFGTGDNGRLYAFSANITTNTIEGKLLKSGAIGCYTSCVNVTDNITNVVKLDDITADNFESVFDVAATPSIVGYATEEDYDANTNAITIEPTDGSTVNITNPYVKISGLITSPISYDPAEVVDLTIQLNGALIKTAGNVPAINYVPSSGKVKISTTKDTRNVILTTDTTNTTPELTESDCIKSENNIRIEVKNGSSLFIQSKNGDGIDGGDVKITDSKGSLVVCGCGLRGIKGNAVVIGPNANVEKSVITPIENVTDADGYYVNSEDTENYADLQGAVVCTNNCTVAAESVVGSDVKNTGMADIYCRNGKATKGVFGTTDTELKGILLVGSIAAVVGINTNNASRLYYNRALTEVTNDCGAVTIADNSVMDVDGKIMTA